MTLRIAVLLAVLPSFASAGYLGNLSSNLYLPPAPSVPKQVIANHYGSDSNNAKLYDSQGGFRGNLNTSRYDTSSVANPLGASPYAQDSPNNPYGQGLLAYEP